MDVLRQLIDLHLVWHYRYDLLRGFLYTLELSAATFAAAFTVSLLLVVGRMKGPWFLAKSIAVLVVLLRSVPAVVGVVFVFFALPFAGITLSPFVAVVATLATIQAVYFAEIFRSALLAVDKGQFEAAYAAGLGPFSVYRRVVIR
jgi:polar amino acid transport system permease protein